MINFESVDAALDFAMEGEQESYEFYKGLADKMEKQEMKDIFNSFAAEELGHKGKLQAVKDGKLMMNSEQKITDLKIGDYLVDVKPSAEMSYQDALTLAMKKEKAAYRLYTDLAKTVVDENLKNTFQALAQEEAKHKLRFEIAYDDEILTEN